MNAVLRLPVENLSCPAELACISQRGARRMISCCFQPLQPCSSHFSSSSSSSSPSPQSPLCPSQTLSKLPNYKPIEKRLAAVWGETAAVQRSCSSLSSCRCQSVVIRTHLLSLFSPLSLSNVIFERAHSSRLTMGRARSAEGHRDTGAE